MAKKSGKRRASGKGRGSGKSGAVTSSASFGRIRFGAVNGILLAAGLAAAAVGYKLLSDGSTVAAPLLLVLGYVVLIPLAIVW